MIASLPQQCERVPACHHMVTLQGTRRTPTKMSIELEAFDPATAKTQGRTAVLISMIYRYILLSMYGNQSSLLTGATPCSSTHTQRDHHDQPSQLVELCKRHNLSNEDIDKEVSDEHILKIYPQLEKWKRVAAHLGLTQADVHSIEGRARPDEELMRLYMLQDWKTKKRLAGTATYRVLLKALIECNCSESAIQVCELLS